MLKEFTKNDATFTPRQSFGSVEQWECDGNWFTVKHPVTRKKIVEAFFDFLEIQSRKSDDSDI